MAELADALDSGSSRGNSLLAQNNLIRGMSRSDGGIATVRSTSVSKAKPYGCRLR